MLVKCEKCGGQMVLRDGKRGPWLGCASFPKCRGIKTMSKLAGEELKHVESLIPALKQSAADAQALVAKVMGTANLPSNGVPQNIPTDIDCDECGKPMIIRTGRRGRFLGCSGYPKCKNTGEVPAKLLEELGISDNGKNGNGATPPPPPTDEE